MSKKILLLFLFSAGLFFLPACGPKAAPDNLIRIGLLSIDDSLPFFTAEQEGFYTKHGAVVELITFGSAVDKETALEAGGIDGDMTDLIVANLLKKGDTDVKAVCVALGAKITEGRFVLLAAPGNQNIKDAADLKGVPVAVGSNTLIHYLNDKIASLSGFGADESVIINIPDLGLRLEALLGGRIKAAILPDPLASLAVLNGASVVADFTQSEKNYSQSVVLFTQKAIDSKGAEIQKVMDAYFEAMVFINENPDSEAVRSALYKFCRIPEALQDLYPTPRYTPRALPDAELMADVSDWMLEKGLCEKICSYEDMVDSRFAVRQP
ncbi:MAG: ABC transporter substrate-binding protein [Oscillospiraceae bacterium]|nr:ABC transporter substrate-binding protein [Oscillospiraceae bacterium]